jgi:urease
MKMMLQASDTIPMNFAFTGKGNTSAPEGLIDIIEAGIKSSVKKKIF